MGWCRGWGGGCSDDDALLERANPQLKGQSDSERLSINAAPLTYLWDTRLLVYVKHHIH